MPTPRSLASLLVLPGGLALLTGMDAGLTLAGVPAPVGSARLAELHGPLMVLGFLGTVIALERATALRAGWGFLAPGLCAAGALALVVLPEPLAGRLLLAQGLLTLALVYAALWRRNRDVTIAVEGLGAVLALAATLLLTRVEVAAVLPLLIGFVVLTIAAERVELARLAMPSGAGDRVAVLAGAVALAAATAVAVAGSPVVGAVAWRALGLTLLLLTLWLVRHDVARRTINATGLPRFAAAALLAGYVWLALAGLLLLLVGRPGGSVYDVVVHATFLGFAMSMILAHAPVILPAVLRVRLPYHRAMWVPLVLLHLTLAGRVLSLALVGIGLRALPVWQLALLGNVAALLLFLLTSVVIGTRATRAARRPAPHETVHHA
ncbi:hypothetical protein [Ornithinimicrobium flavum]|uniref:hypothetical protein n=1 Tax=Ornithinimicrobium flavum TaxID=1288636 RepID=UPI0010705FEC|nr:hypothetical protein [Ornithinimicrobium flavum]